MKKLTTPKKQGHSSKDYKKVKRDEVGQLIQKNNSGASKKNLLTFSDIIFKTITDHHFLWGLDVKDAYQIILNYFNFFMEEFQPAGSRFKDLPPTSIKIFNPLDKTDDKEALRHFEFETTVIQIHTLDGPFIFESVWNYLKKREIHIFGAVHCVIPVLRNNSHITRICETVNKHDKEVFFNIYVEKIVNTDNLKRLEIEILSVLMALFWAITDFKKMVLSVEDLVTMKKNLSPAPENNALEREFIPFLKWLIDENFIFMGLQSYEMKKSGKEDALIRSKSTRLGIFRDMELMETVFPGQIGEIEKKIQQSSQPALPIKIDFINSCSSVIYHFDPIDFIDVECFSDNKKKPSRLIIFGRFSRGAMFQKSSTVPILSGKITKLLKTTEKGYSSHYKREFFTAFNHLTKRDLFYLNTDSLLSLIEVILSIQNDEDVKIFLKRDELETYISLFIVFSKSKYEREVREKIRKLFTDKFNRPISRWVDVDCISNVVLIFYIDTRDEEDVEVDVKSLERDIMGIITTWDDCLARRLVQKNGDHEGFGLYNQYKLAFSALYKEITDIEDTVSDIRYIECLKKEEKVSINIFQSNSREVEIKIYSHNEIDLMTIIPTAQNLGLYVTSEQVLPLNLDPGFKVYIHIFRVSGDRHFLLDLLKKRSLISEMLIKIMDGKTVNDKLNHLVLKAGFNWKSVELFRTLKNYLLQINRANSANSIDNVLIRFVEITKNLFKYFETRFMPSTKDFLRESREELLEACERRFQESLIQVSSLMEDQIFRSLFDILKNMLRTNFYISPTANYISFKIDCRGINKMPSPRPLYEIYVHTPELEGVHLRGGRVARGGLRWSDRYDDFRKEILGLMKTQMVKNSVIVPFGSKGGFVLKRKEFKNQKEREDFLKKQYQIFISGLLDITDNIVEGKTVSPKNVVAYDSNDPYLVVAADKGTAKLSDAANEISGKYNYWLGDAFASGGAVGYDHKKEGITAKGAWECVKRHFREQGVDIQSESIRVAGIGDMAGDVFGNGMLLSKKIKLVAAFNHMHIFLDPSPDPEKSWLERKRLFENPELTWLEYSKELISKGGGVFLRSSKSITLSPETKNMLGISDNILNGEELIKSVLTMQVDLLWNGGIGTYIKSSSESHLDVGDKSNDRVRVNAIDIKANVLGEGGNLGITQLGRIEASKNGVACNTDAVDNSAGVDMSDHEVNIKILLDNLLESGEIKSLTERNEMFAHVTDEVTKLVLADNYLQGAAISMDHIRSIKRPEPFLNLIDNLSALKVINKKDEFIPDRKEMSPGAEKGIIRPILAVLLGYEKMFVYQKILHSDLMDTVFVSRYLNDYFPEIFHREFLPFIKKHRLKKEIISTVITNKIINQTGMTYFYTLREKTGKDPWEIARAYIIIENMLDGDGFRNRVYNLDTIVPSKLQYQMLIDLENVIFQLTDWMLINMPEDRINFDLINQYQGIIAKFEKNLIKSLESVCSLEKGCLDKQLTELRKKNLPKDLGERYVVLPYLKDIMAILKIKEELHFNFIDTGNLYIKVSNYLSLDWIVASLTEIDSSDEWEDKAVENLYEELKYYQNRIVVNILKFKRHEELIDDCFYSYLRENTLADKAFMYRLENIKTRGKMDLVAFSVLIRSLKDFCG